MIEKTLLCVSFSPLHQHIREMLRFILLVATMYDTFDEVDKDYEEITSL